jgi:hypothetical protein
MAFVIATPRAGGLPDGVTPGIRHTIAAQVYAILALCPPLDWSDEIVAGQSGLLILLKQEFSCLLRASTI